MNIFNLCTENKYVKFNKIIKIILIPSIYDECIKKNKNNIWYNKESYEYFIQNEKNRLLYHRNNDEID